MRVAVWDVWGHGVAAGTTTTIIVGGNNNNNDDDDNDDDKDNNDNDQMFQQVKEPITDSEYFDKCRRTFFPYPFSVPVTSSAQLQDLTQFYIQLLLLFGKNLLEESPGQNHMSNLQSSKFLASCSYAAKDLAYTHLHLHLHLHLPAPVCGDAYVPLNFHVH